jgi:hypothetical protein
VEATRIMLMSITLITLRLSGVTLEGVTLAKFNTHLLNAVLTQGSVLKNPLHTSSARLHADFTEEDDAKCQMRDSKGSLRSSPYAETAPRKGACSPFQAALCRSR